MSLFRKAVVPAPKTRYDFQNTMRILGSGTSQCNLCFNDVLKVFLTKCVLSSNFFRWTYDFNIHTSFVAGEL